MRSQHFRLSFRSAAEESAVNHLIIAVANPSHHQIMNSPY
jgi:hypothetical protein